MLFISQERYTKPSYNSISGLTRAVAASLFPLESEKGVQTTFEAARLEFVDGSSPYPIVDAAHLISPEDMAGIVAALHVLKEMLVGVIRWDKVRESLQELDQISSNVAEYAIALATDTAAPRFTDVMVDTFQLKPFSLEIPEVVRTVDDYDKWMEASVEAYAISVRRALLADFFRECTSGDRGIDVLRHLIEIGMRCRTYFDGVRAALACRVIPSHVETETEMPVASSLSVTRLENVRNAISANGFAAARGPRVYSDIAPFFPNPDFFMVKASYEMSSAVENTRVLCDYDGRLDVKISRVANARLNRPSTAVSSARVNNSERLALIQRAWDDVTHHRMQLLALNPSDENSNQIDTFWNELQTLPTPVREETQILTTHDVSPDPLSEMGAVHYPEIVDFTPYCAVSVSKPLVAMHDIYLSKSYGFQGDIKMGCSVGQGDLPEKYLMGLSPLLIALQSRLVEPFELGNLITAMSGFALVEKDSIKEIILHAIKYELPIITSDVMKDTVKRAGMHEPVDLGWAKVVSRLTSDAFFLDPGIPGPWGLSSEWWADHKDLMRVVEVGSIRFWVPTHLIIWPQSNGQYDVYCTEPIDRCEIWWQSPSTDHAKIGKTDSVFCPRVDVPSDLVYAADHPLMTAARDLGVNGDLFSSKAHAAAKLTRTQFQMGDKAPTSALTVIAIERNRMLVGERITYRFARMDKCSAKIKATAELSLGFRTEQITQAVITPLPMNRTQILLMNPGVRQAVSSLGVPPDQNNTDILTASRELYYSFDIKGYAPLVPIETTGNFMPLKAGVDLQTVWEKMHGDKKKVQVAPTAKKDNEVESTESASVVSETKSEPTTSDEDTKKDALTALLSKVK